MGFADDFGQSRDAFGDSLHTDFDVEYVEVIGAETVSQQLKNPVERIKQILEKRCITTSGLFRLSLFACIEKPRQKQESVQMTRHG